VPHTLPAEPDTQGAPQLPPDIDWEDVKTFAMLAGRGTVRAAAAALSVHHSTVSRRLDKLEFALGVRLFDRRPEGLVLTEAGEILLPVARQVSGRLQDVSRLIQGSDGMLSGRVRVTMAEPIAVHAFAPRLPEFVKRFPGLDLEIAVTSDFLDLNRHQADLAVRMDNNPPDTLVGKRLFPYCASIYASPGYLASQDFQTAPQHGRWLGWGDSSERFPAWTQATEFARVPVWGAFANLPLQIAAARAGLGLARLPCYVGDRAAGLVRATGRPPEPTREIWLLTHPDLRKTTRIRAVMAFAEECLRSEQAALMGEI